MITVTKTAPVHTERSQPVTDALLAHIRSIPEDFHRAVRESLDVDTTISVLLALIAPDTESAIQMLLHRNAMGIARYGTELHTHNGLDASKEAAEEACDTLKYTYQKVLENLA